ncbi:hypothetical protein GCM10009551_074890 [Nocardiopsis tropica]
MPHVIIDPELETAPPPVEMTCDWRPGALLFDEDTVVPLLVVQISYSEIVRKPNGDTVSAFVQNLMNCGMQLASLGILDADAVGHARVVRPGVLSADVSAFELLREADFTLAQENLDWLDYARSLGRFVLLAGTGIHVPTDGLLDITNVGVMGSVVWGWIEIDDEPQHEISS